MTKWTIYDKDGKPRCECIVDFDGKGRAVSDDKLEYNGSWMGDCFVSVTVKSAYPIDFHIGDYVEYRGERFTINYDPGVIKKARRGAYGEGFTYDNIKFNAYSNELTEIQFHDWVLSDNNLHYTSLPNFSFYCKDVDDLVDRLQANTDRWCRANGFRPDEYWMFYTLRNNTESGTEDAGQTQTTYERTVQRARDITDDEEFLAGVKTKWEAAYGTGDNYKDSHDDERFDRSVSVSSQTVWDMLGAVKQQFGLNFVIRGRDVYVGRHGIPTTHIFKYGKNNGLYEIDKVADQDQKVVTKLHAYGSNENLPTRYYADLNTVAYSEIAKITDNNKTEYLYCKFELDLDYASRYFTDAMSQYGDNIYAVKIQVDDITVNARVQQTGDQTKICIYSECVENPVDPDDNGDAVVFGKFQNAIAVGKRVIFTGGVKKDAWPIDHITASSENLPDNMAVNFLMLPGFPNHALSNICRAEYDGDNDVTNYYITDKPTDGEWTLFHTESGKHVVTFSGDKYDPYILSPNATELGIKEGDIFCNEENDDNGLKKVYPTIEGVTDKDAGTGSTGKRLDAVESADVIEDNGVWPNEKSENVPGFNIYVPDPGFDLRKAAQDAGGSDMKISMKSGFCEGRTFDVANCSEVKDGNMKGCWKLECKRSLDDSLDLYFPYSYAASVSGVDESMTNAYQIVKGDNFVITGISVSDINYVNAASVKLLRKAIHWLCKNDYTRYVYTPKIDEIFMARQDRDAKANNEDSYHDTLKEGDIMLFEDDDLNLKGSVYIDKLVIKEGGNNGIPTYDVTLRDDVTVGTLQRIQNQVDSIKSDLTRGAYSEGLGVSDVDRLVKVYGVKYFLSRLNDDTAQGVITFLKGILLGDGTHGVTGEGDATLNSVTGDGWSVDKNGKGILRSLVTDLIKSTGFTSDDLLSGTGYHMYTDADGKSHVVTDYLTTRIKAYFSELEIQKTSYSGGNIIFSGAGNTIAFVEEVNDANGEGYKCWFLASDGEEEVENMWKVGDQAMCRMANLATGSKVGNRYYWRLVTETGKEEKTFTNADGTSETKTMGYVVLSDRGADDYFSTIYTDGTTTGPQVTPDSSRSGVFQGKQSDDNDAPAVGDAIVAMGSQADRGRMKAVQIASVSLNKEPAPAINFYSGVNGYTMTPVFYISPDGISGKVKFVDLTITNEAGEPVQLVNFRGDWQEDFTYVKGDMVTYDGQSWLWNNTEPTTGTAPSETAGWSLVARSGKDGQDGQDGQDGKDGQNGQDGKDGESPYKLEIVTTTGNVIKNGNGSTTLKAYVYQGDTQLSDVSAINFVWELYDKDGKSRNWYGTSSGTKQGKGLDTVTLTQNDVTVKSNIICKISK